MDEQPTRLAVGPWMMAVLLIGLSIGFWCEPFSVAEERAAIGRTQSPASPSIDESSLEKRLSKVLANQEKILANQAEILQKFDAVMEELRIIKVRATIRGS